MQVKSTKNCFTVGRVNLLISWVLRKNHRKLAITNIRKCVDKRKTAPQFEAPSSCGGGWGRIRTSEGLRHQIYSLAPLTAREPTRSLSDCKYRFFG